VTVRPFHRDGEVDKPRDGPEVHLWFGLTPLLPVLYYPIGRRRLPTANRPNPASRGGMKYGEGIARVGSATGVKAASFFTK